MTEILSHNVNKVERLSVCGSVSNGLSVGLTPCIPQQFLSDLPRATLPTADGDATDNGTETHRPELLMEVKDWRVLEGTCPENPKDKELSGNIKAQRAQGRVQGSEESRKKRHKEMGRDQIRG